ncbi:RNA-guided endonuclease TnpB family protein [Anaeromicrobium sediminis]|uniref:Cas12f1-like TNB domain-containing protein n=1 Tax=Anaeromicrobium sediminis TaxID=1478221 RepID=A0A267MNZ8_9FIRM|nr:RNA-guided endonuclease TnpB family protein [Anaeromicrobium sediminis]PAB60543.1 hypothetical protein CCE28_03090 [Anaeromicrobium sediminis]
MDTIMKTVKQYSKEIDLEELQYIANQYKNVKNYVYSRYSGVNSILILPKYRKEIRDVWVKSKFAEQWKLPARYWKQALDEAIANIKTEWSNIKNRIKICVNNNENLSNEEKYYIRYILKADKLYQDVLTYKSIHIPKKFEDKKLNFKYLNNMIRRLTRRYKKSIPYSRECKSFMIDAQMYSYQMKKDMLYINIMTAKRGKRLCIELTDKQVHSGNLRVVLDDRRIQVHKGLQTQVKENNNSNIIGIDKGYKYLFAVSSGKFYGEKLNKFLNSETERLNKVNKQRNRFWALYKSHLEEGNVKKANAIKENNLGKVKYNHNKLKHNQTVKAYINHSLNELIKNETPKEIVMEKLDFVSWNDRYPKSIKRKLSRWIKGYIRDRLEYKCDLNRVKYTYVNPAYTSKVCNMCGEFGKRRGDVFKCPKCGEIHADSNASINILNRNYDKEISLYTPYKKVKEILEKRVS